MPRHRITPAAQRAGCEAVQARANKRAADLAPIIAELRAVGITSFNGIAGALNERGIPTTRGSGRWYHAQVRRMLARLPA
jgi:Recombinase